MQKNFKTKSLIAAVVVFSLCAGLVSAFSFTASAASLISVTDTCSYTITTNNVGLPHYRDAEGEQKLFDGVIPTTEELDDAVQEAVDRGDEPSLLGWFQWKGWIGIHSTGADSYITNSAVDINFEFDEPVQLKKLIVHCAAMEKGNVYIPSDYEIYLSEDGATWDTTPISTTPTEYQDGVAVKDINTFDDTVILLDEAVETKYFKLVAKGVACWWFCSEVEIFAESSVIIDMSSSPAASEPKTPEPTVSEPAVPAEPGSNIALHKEYTVSETEPRGDGWDDGGAKLTDGIKVRSSGNDANVAGFLTHDLDVVIDLGAATTVAGFSTDAFGCEDWGIPSPTLYTVEYFYSTDGADFTSAGVVSGEGLEPVCSTDDGWLIYEFNLDLECECRYVKVVYSVPEDQVNHLWISEIEVYKAEDETPVEESSAGETPPTGDTGVYVLAFLSVVALAGVTVFKRKR